MESDADYVRAARQHIKITVSQLRCPLGSLPFVGQGTDQTKGLVIFPQRLDDALRRIAPTPGSQAT